MAVVQAPSTRSSFSKFVAKSSRASFKATKKVGKASYAVTKGSIKLSAAAATAVGKR